MTNCWWLVAELVHVSKFLHLSRNRGWPLGTSSIHLTICLHLCPSLASYGSQVLSIHWCCLSSSFCASPPPYLLQKGDLHENYHILTVLILCEDATTWATVSELEASASLLTLAKSSVVQVCWYVLCKLCVQTITHLCVCMHGCVVCVCVCIRVHVCLDMCKYTVYNVYENVCMHVKK